MIKTLLLLMFIIFAVAGICEFIYILKMFFFLPKKQVISFSLFVLEPHTAVKQLSFMWQKIRWHGNAFAHGIIAITDRLDTKEQLLCGEYAKEKNIFLCSSNDILQNINLQGENFNG